MPLVSCTPAVRSDYERLFNTCNIKAEKAAEVDAMVARIAANRARYEQVANAVGIPWFFVALVHNMEAGLRFDRHLHNGDPLTARTVQVPAGRPRTGNPPFTWQQSACDALTMRKLGPETDWSLAGTLYQLEGYNGWGYRLHHPEVPTPYLWSYSVHYRGGKYVADGTWSNTAVSKQCGAAVLLRRMAERGLIEFRDQPPPPEDRPLVVRHSNRKPIDPVQLERAITLQRWLNTFAGIFVKEDGVPGDRTSDAYRLVTGSYLPGDPRGG
jgi:lysozyme family protein